MPFLVFSVLYMYTSAKPPLTGYPYHRVSLSRRKAVVALQLEVLNFVDHYRPERCAFLTICPPADMSLKAAQVCLNNAGRRLLKELFPAWLTVVEFHGKDRPHFHLLVSTHQDYRTGFNFQHYHQMKEIGCRAHREGRALTNAEKQERGFHARNLTSHPGLKALWKQLRKKLPQFGFSKARPAELIPIEKNGIALAFYLTKQFTAPDRLQHNAPKGARLVRYSANYLRVVPKLAHLILDTPGRRKFLHRRERICEVLGGLTHAEMAISYGHRWHWRCWQVSMKLDDRYGKNPIPWASAEVLALIEEVMNHGYERPAPIEYFTPAYFKQTGGWPTR